MLLHAVTCIFGYSWHIELWGLGSLTVVLCALVGSDGESHPFTVWHSLALLLLAVELFGIMIQLSLWSVVNWLGRTAQWLGGFYLLLAAIAAWREAHLPLLPLGERSRPALYRDAVAVAVAIVQS